MAAPRRRKRVMKSPETRRADLTAAAERLFEARGYDIVTIADITAAAGVAKGTFYLYFASKAELLDALRARLIEDTTSWLRHLTVPGADGDWSAFIRALVEGAIAFQVEQYERHELFRVPHVHAEPDGPGEGTDPVRLLLRQILEAGVRSNRLRVGDMASATDVVYDFLHLASDRACREPARRQAIAGTTADLLVQGLVRP